MLSLEETAKELFTITPPTSAKKEAFIEFPEINRKLRVQCSYVSGSSSLGCHSGTITGVSIHLNMGATSTPSGFSITTIDPSGEQIKYTKDSFNYYRITNTEWENIFDYIKKSGLTFDHFAPSIFASIVTQTSRVPIYAISDVINYNTPARNGGIFDIVKEPHKTIFDLFVCNTSDFVRYLIKDKVGVVVESPVVQNPNHRYWGGYSLNQMWIWVHPNHLSRTINCSALHNIEALPTREDWFNTIKSDFSGIGTIYSGNKNGKDLLSNIIPTEVFMKDNRFVDGRDQSK
jgi:hypothetical protein